MGGPFCEKGKAGLKIPEAIQIGGGDGFPRGVEGAEFGERGFLRGGEWREGGFEIAVDGSFFGGEEGASERAGSGGLLLQKCFRRTPPGRELHEKVSERIRDVRRAGEEGGRGEFEKVTDAEGGFAERSVGGIECGESVAAASGIGMMLGRGAMKAFAQSLRIEPRTARLGEGGEVVGHGAGVRAVPAARSKGNFPAGCGNGLCPGEGVSYHVRRPRLMKFPAFHSALVLGLTLALSACHKPIADKAVIFGAIHENVHALEKKDVETVMATIHPQCPVYADTKAVVEEMFRSVDLKYTLSDLRVVSATPEEVKVSFTQKTEKLSGEAQFENNIVEGIHTLRPDKGTWKIYKTLQTKITDLKGKPLFAPDAPPPTSPILPEGQMPTTPVPPPPVQAVPAPATPTAP